MPAPFAGCSCRPPSPGRPRSRRDAFCTSRGVPMASTSPWFMASTRSDTLDTSVMSCSTISTVMPSSCLMSWIQKAMSSVSSTFRPDEGSSSSSSLGSVHSARASSTTLRTPYGRPATMESRWCCRSRNSITCSHLLARLDLGLRAPCRVKNRSLHRPVLRCVWRPISRLCSTVACSNSSMFWKVRAMPSEAILCGGCCGERAGLRTRCRRWWACRCG